MDTCSVCTLQWAKRAISWSGLEVERTCNRAELKRWGMAVQSAAIGNPGISDDSAAEPGRRMLGAAEEAVNRWVSREAAADGGYGVSDFPALAAAVKDLISLGSHGGAYSQRAKLALEVTCMFRKSVPSFTQGNLHTIVCTLYMFSLGKVLDLFDLAVEEWSVSY